MPHVSLTAVTPFGSFRVSGDRKLPHYFEEMDVPRGSPPLKELTSASYYYIFMLVDLSKEELRALSEVSLENSNLELSEEGTEFWTNIYLKLRNISKSCTCKEDSNAK